MKMNIRKFTSAVAAVVMCLSMASCGQNDSSSSPAKTDKAETAASRTETVTDLTTTAPDTDDVKNGLAADGEPALAEMEGGEMKTAAVRTDRAATGDTSPDIGAGDPGKIRETPVTSQKGEAFVLTAGEWNDNKNWGFFTNLIKNGTITFPAFGLDPAHRIAVTVTKDGAPANDRTVELIDSEGNVIWTAKSDKNGMAYVFYNKEQTPAQVRSGEASQEVTGDSNDGQGRAGTSEAALEVTDSKKYEDTQVMFILDTTGSMADEIAYLQKDFASIAKETDNGHTGFSVNFYRDEGDDYVTKCNPFSTDVQAIQSAINQESADGGGDMPEAIAEILQETITDNEEWSESANKIAFLIFDAPPHDGKEQQLEAAVKTAAAKGIRLVPVVSSGANRETELFGRAIAAMTGGNYVFLTDDSGVGGSHLEPIIGDYEVEKLHDIIVRNITELRG